MKTILFHYLPNMFDLNSRDQGNMPFVYLRDSLYKLNYELKTSNNHHIEDADWIFFLNSSIPDDSSKNKIKKITKTALGKTEIENRNLYQECLDKNFKNKVLFLWENKCIAPHSYLKKITDNFNYIFTWDDDLVDNKKFFKFYLPIPFPPNNIPKIPFGQKKLLVNISRNKISSYPGELYSAREKSIKYFDDNYPNDFDLFGMRWHKPITRWQKIFPFLISKYRCYRGEINRKFDILPNYKFSLCYENFKNQNGYITEKIFDGLTAGTVPIYFGANNVSDYINPYAFIDRRKFKSDKELAKFITNITKEEYIKYQIAIKKYLNSKRFLLFLPENFANTIIKSLSLKK